MTRARLCAEHELSDGQARGFYAVNRELLLVRKEGTVFAYENRCPHRGTSLDWAPDRFLSPDGSMLQCATHGALFRIEDGVCERGPCVGDRLRALEVECSAGELWLVTSKESP